MQISKDLWNCRECTLGDVEDIRHWLLQCSAWEANRFPLMQKMREYLVDFPALNDKAKVAMILTAQCQIPSILNKIYYNTDYD